MTDEIEENLPYDLNALTTKCLPGDNSNDRPVGSGV